MTTALEDPAVRAYLAELRHVMADRPADERELVIDGVRQHIEDALGGGPADAARVQQVLADLGDPMAIAAESSEQQQAAAPAAPASVSLLDRRGGAVLTVLLLVFGGFVVPVLGWIAGVVLLWSSHGWRTVDKVIGTAAPAVCAALGLVVGAGLAATGMLDGWTHLAVLAGLLLGVVLDAAYLLARFRPLG